VYLKAYQDGREAKISLGNYFRFYNTGRPHQSLDYKTPAEVYAPFLTLTLVATIERKVVESFASYPLTASVFYLNSALVLS
jgi:putative transposase